MENPDFIMKNSSQASVRMLFNLPETEKIFDDFGCAYSDGILYHGRMFITEHYICFNSNILGISTKFKIQFSLVKSIKRKKKFFFNNSIEITSSEFFTKDGTDKIFLFTSFTNRDLSYKRIKNILKVYKMRTSKGLSSESSVSSSDENEEKKQMTLPPTSNHQSSDDLRNPNQREENNEETKKIVSRESIKQNEEDVFFPPFDQEKEVEFPKIVFHFPPEEFHDKFLKNNAEYGFDKFSIHLARTEVNCADWKKLDSSVSSIHDVNIEDGLKENQEKLLGDNRKQTNSSGVSKTQGKDQKEVIKHVKDDDFTQEETYVRQLHQRVAVKNVPLVTSTRVVKTQKLTVGKDKSYYNFSSSGQNLDIPYSNYFTFEETWEVRPYEEGKCILRILIRVVMMKSTFFKSKIEKTTKDEFSKEVNFWKEYVKAQGVEFSDYEKPNKTRKDTPELRIETLKHGIRKSDSFGSVPVEMSSKLSIKKMVLEFYQFTSFKDIVIVLVVIVFSLVIRIIFNKVDRIENMLLELTERRCSN